MDRTSQQEIIYNSAVSARRSEPFQLLLSAAAEGKSVQPAGDERDRQDIHSAPLLRISTNNRYIGRKWVGSQSQAEIGRAHV